MSFVYHNPMQVRCKDDVQVFRQWLKGYRKVMWAAHTLQLSLTLRFRGVVACVVIMPLPRGICRRGLPVDRFRDFGGLPNIPHTTPQRKVKYEGKTETKCVVTTVRALVLLTVVVGLDSLSYSMCATLSFDSYCSAWNFTYIAATGRTSIPTTPYMKLSRSFGLYIFSETEWC